MLRRSTGKDRLTHAIETRGLMKSFSKTRAVDGIDLQIRPSRKLLEQLGVQQFGNVEGIENRRRSDAHRRRVAEDAVAEGRQQQELPLLFGVQAKPAEGLLGRCP